MPVRARLYAPVYTGHGTHPAPCARGNVSLTGGKGVMKPGRGDDYPLLSKAKI
jgi:hypothetical protein